MAGWCSRVVGSVVCLMLSSQPLFAQEGPYTDHSDPLSTQVTFDDPLLNRRGSWGQAYADQWGLFEINGFRPRRASEMAAPVYQPADLKPVVVALVDTGIDYRHPELPRDRLWVNPLERSDGLDNDGNGRVDDLIGWDFISNSNQPWDDHGHGTHIAGIIAAKANNGRGISGVASNARLMVLKALNSAGYGRGSDIAEAIHYAVDQGAELIHLSLGGKPPGPLERRAIAYAQAAGRLVVVAAGNRSELIAEQGFESIPEVLVVGAVAPGRQRARFSDWGTRLDLVAPGVDVLSLRAWGSDFLLRDGEQGYQPGDAIVSREYYRASGNSFAAPFVTAAAAVLLGQNPQLSPSELKRVLRQSAQPLGPEGHDQLHGAGLVDVAAALEQVPAHFLVAQFNYAEWQPEQGLLLYGRADADQFISARLEYGIGLKPSYWQMLDTPVIRQPRNGPLAVIQPDQLPAEEWVTLRLVVEHADGSFGRSQLQLQRLQSGERE